MNLQSIAENFIFLTHEIGLHNEYHVDAYYGPEELIPAKGLTKEHITLDNLAMEAEVLLKNLEEIETKEQFRVDYLRSQLKSAQSLIEKINGRSLSFDEESKAIFGITALEHTEKYFLNIHRELEGFLSILESDFGLSFNGDLRQRLQEFYKILRPSKEFIEPAIKKTTSNVRDIILPKITTPLPEYEEVRQGFVENVSWGGYNGYQGDALSEVVTNTDAEVSVFRILQLALHESYPGHHVYHSLQDIVLYDKDEENRVEFSVFPLFSPMATISEGLAVYGEHFSLTKDEKIGLLSEITVHTDVYERLLDLGIKDQEMEKLLELYLDMVETHNKLDHTSVELGRMIYDDMEDEQAIQWKMQHGLVSEKRAKQNLDFIKQFGSYMVLYTAAADLIDSYIEQRMIREVGENIVSRDFQWKVFNELLISPAIPQDLFDYVIAHSS